MQPEAELHGTLDRAIDDLLASGSWSLVDDGATDEELRPLMDVAAQVLDLARRTPPADAGQKQRIWLKLKRAFGRSGDVALPGSPITFLRARASALPGRRGISLGGGCAPLREVRRS
jgi:hypothetical protein